MPDNDAIVMISDQQQLNIFCETLEQQPWIAVDTEFLREKTYRPQLCLIQIACPDAIACIDPLVLENIDRLVDIMFNRDILKIFHSASQDLEIFYWMRKEVPGPIFDTQVAAPLLGYNEQIGYGNLVNEVLGVTLSKAHSRADWTRRPLPEVQIKYAADDVIYLAQLYPIMRDQLQAKNRLAWLDTEFKNVENKDLYEKPATEVWLKIRAVQRLKGSALSTVQKLAEWRELTARSNDLPRNWVLRDDAIVDIARQAPNSLEELSHLRGLSEGTRRRHGKTLLELIELGKNTPPIPLPTFAKKTKLSAKRDAIVDILSAVVKLRAAEHDVNAVILAPRKELEKLLTDKESSSLLQGWRKELIGDELNDLLEGKFSLRVNQEGITLTTDK